MGIPIVRGRGFTTADDDRAEPVVVINRTMAERYWPNENPINRRVRVTAGYDAGSWFRIVGIADNVRHIALSREPVTEMYRPFAQTGIGVLSFAVKTTGEPAAERSSVRAAMQAVDRNMPVYACEPWRTGSRVRSLRRAARCSCCW